MRKRFALLLLVISFFVLSFAQVSVRSDSLKQNHMIPPDIGASSQPKQIIRCKLSCNSWTPIIVMNGTLTEKHQLININPDDIKSITFLKGIQALGCYGPVSKFGIIVIETKAFDELTLKSIRKTLIGSVSFIKYSRKIITTNGNFNNDVNMKLFPNPLRESQTFNINFITKRKNGLRLIFLRLMVNLLSQ